MISAHENESRQLPVHSQRVNCPTCDKLPPVFFAYGRLPRRLPLVKFPAQRSAIRWVKMSRMHLQQSIATPTNSNPDVYSRPSSGYWTEALTPSFLARRFTA